MRGLLIKGMDVTEVRASELEEFYELMEIDIIDIVVREINGKYYDIICDDEALLKEQPIPTMLDVDEMPMIFGNIIIAGLADETGNMTDLTDEDIANITDKLGVIKLIDGRQNVCVLDVKY